MLRKPLEVDMLRKPLEVEPPLLSTPVEVERSMLRKPVVVGMRNVWEWDGESCDRRAFYELQQLQQLQ
jgi:hypothetical protein